MPISFRYSSCCFRNWPNLTLNLQLVAHRKYSVSITKTKLIILSRKIISASSKSCASHRNALLGQTVEFCSVKTDVTSSNHWNVKSKGILSSELWLERRVNKDHRKIWNRNDRGPTQSFLIFGLLHRPKIKVCVCIRTYTNTHT
jgi:hypothetical protein